MYPSLTSLPTFWGHQGHADSGLAPTGYTKMVHPQGEAAVGRAAARAGTPDVLSTMSSTRSKTCGEFFLGAICGFSSTCGRTGV